MIISDGAEYSFDDTIEYNLKKIRFYEFAISSYIISESRTFVDVSATKVRAKYWTGTFNRRAPESNKTLIVSNCNCSEF